MARTREVRSEVRWEKHLQACGRGLEMLDLHASSRTEGEVCLQSVKLLLQADNGTSVLGVLVGVLDGKELVSFVGGPDAMTVVLAIGKKLMGKGLRWRESRPWQG